MIDKTPLPIQKGLGMPACAVLLFKKGKSVLLRINGLIKLEDSELALGKSAAACEFIVEVSLGKRKGRSCFGFCPSDKGYLIVRCGERV